MNCHEVEKWLSAYEDRELDLARTLEIEEHLAECAGCSAALRKMEETSALLASAVRFPAPPELRRRFGAPGARIPWHTAPWLAAAASLALAVVVVWRYAPPAQHAPDLLERDIVQEHVRSLLADHLLDVNSPDRQTVKPWFRGKLDYAPEVADLSSQGFELVGGRLDYLGGRAVSALVYQRAQHVINVFVWPEAGQPDQAPQPHSIAGFNAVNWRSKGMNWWAISDLNSVELEELPLCPCFMPPSRTLHAATPPGMTRNPS
ncbi:MAG: anti-sigma factor [Terriglobia bacterium]|nr:MAG: anti-sigma factor [Terriglobia bacterium]